MSKCERMGCGDVAEYLVDYVERCTGNHAFRKKMCSKHKKATYLTFRVTRIEVMNEEEKKVDIKEVMGNVCNGCGKPAVCDLIFGEMAEMVKVPWCAHCMVPNTWDQHPFHHAEAYTTEHWGKAIGKEPEIRNHKCTEVPPFKNAKVGLGLYKEPMPKFVEEIPMSKALYSRQPHYEGGIDPITFGQDNLSTNEMNGFYKMNVIKYVARCDRKNGLEDLKKAQDYLNLLIASYESEVGKHEPMGEEGMDAVSYFVNMFKESGRITLEPFVPNETKQVIVDMLRKMGYNLDIGLNSDGEMDISKA